MPRKSASNNCALTVSEEPKTVLFAALDDFAKKGSARGAANTTDSARADQFQLDRTQRRELRGKISNRIMWMLYGELSFVIAVVILQGFKPFDFSLNEWMFGLFVNGIILQTFFTVQIIVRHLFPQDKDC
jgi:hypothetical protein